MTAVTILEGRTHGDIRTYWAGCRCDDCRAANAARSRYYVGNGPKPLGPQVLDKPIEWQALGNCFGVDPELFYPQRGGDVAQAKAVCAECVVRDDCLEYALTEPVERFGIWGGRSEQERKALRAERRNA